jgi:hypothetical protein
LRAYRLLQAEELLKIGMAQTDDMFVVARADGQPLQPRSLTHEWVRLIGGAPCPAFASMTCATHTPLTCFPPACILRSPASLGHSKVGITLDLYSHVLPGMQEDAAALVDVALCAAQEKLALKQIG